MNAISTHIRLVAIDDEKEREIFPGYQVLTDHLIFTALQVLESIDKNPVCRWKKVIFGFYEGKVKNSNFIQTTVSIIDR